MEYSIIFHQLPMVMICYLLGNVLWGDILAKHHGLPSLRTSGSGNVGATNMLRVGGKKLAALTLLLDTMKGIIAVLISRYYQYVFDLQIENAGILAGIFVILGHIYPCLHKFRGGKGIATSLGVIVAINWVIATGCLAVWLLIFIASRKSSLSAIAAVTAAPILCYLFTPSLLPFLGFLVPMMLWTHRSNIRRLWEGKEHKF